MNKETIECLLENYMEKGYDRITVYLIDGTYHTFELYNTQHRYNIYNDVLRITKNIPVKQEITIVLDKIEKIITKE